MSLFTLNNTTTESEIFRHTVSDVVVQASGTFSGATLVLEYSQEGLPFHTLDLDDFSIIEDDVLRVSLADNCTYKFKLINTSSSSSVQVSVLRRRL